MRIRKILFIMVLPLIAEVVISCRCKCNEPVINHYSNKSIEVFNLDNSGSKPMLTNANSVLKEAFGIRIKLTRERTACTVPSKSLFIQSAYATSCDCPEPYQILARDSVIAITVSTFYDFDINHPAGSDVSGYFKVLQNTAFTPIPDFVKRLNAALSSESELEQGINCLLMIPPTLGPTHRFKVTINLSDGRVLEEVSSAIDLI